MNILGINCYGHDTSAALLVDGRITQFHEEERFNRQKHTRLYPYHTVNFCLDMNPGGKDAIDFVAYPFRTDDEILKKICASDINPQEGQWLDWRLKHFEKLKEKLPIAGDELGIHAPHRMIGHHESHMASAFFCSPFERAAILSIDGVGDHITTMLGIGEGTTLRVLKTIHHPHGIGYFYTAITEYIGFAPTSDEGKTMGLAPYGRPRFQKEFAQLLALEPEGDIRLNLDYFWHHNTLRQVNPRMADLLGPPRQKDEKIEERHQDIAYCMQERSEQAYFHHLKHLFELTKCENLCLVGGVALNSCANGKIRENTPFKNIFMPPFVHDAGTAIGAAQWLYHHELGNPRVEHENLAYLGYEPGEREIITALADAGVFYNKVDDPSKEAASRIAEGKIVAWYQRRTEAGPRALGNRSILADPRRADMKDMINARVKFREGFRPFAPAVLEERVGEYFESDQPEPFMLQVHPVREEKRGVITSVTHVDGTGRLQTVAHKDNPLFYNLITAFEKLTGVPVVLNTSFNVMGEPIVNRPEEAIRCFMKSGIDVLLLGDYCVEKSTLPTTRDKWMSETGTVKQKVTFIGDCISEILHAHTSDRFPQIDSQGLRVSSFLPMTSAQNGIPESLKKRLHDPQYQPFYHRNSIKDQWGILDLKPNPHLIVTNVISEQPAYLLKHESGVQFFINWQEILDNPKVDSDWIKKECEIVKLQEDEYPKRLFEGLDLMAQHYRDIPILLVLPINRCIALYESNFDLFGMQKYPWYAGETFRQRLKELCEANPNLYVMSFDRIIAEGIKDRGLRHEQFFPYYANSGVQSLAIKRDLTHPSVLFWNDVIGTILWFLKNEKRETQKGIRLIHQEVTEDDVRNLEAIQPTIPGEEEVRKLLVSGDLHSFCYAMNFVEHFPDNTFDDDIITQLMERRMLRGHKLCRNIMLAHIKRHLRIEYLPYICCLFEEHIEDMIQSNAFFKGWAYETILRIREHMFIQAGLTSWNRGDWTNVKQEIYWDDIINRLQQNGVTKIGLFPAGQHSRRFIPYLVKTGQIDVLAVFDEQESLPGTQLEGIAVKHPGQASELGIEAMVISSDSIEDKLYRRFLEINGKKIPTYTIYSKQDPES